MTSGNIEEIWMKLSSNLLLFISGKVGDKSVAEDILHDLYLKVHTSINTLRDDTRIQSWIYQIARNQIIDYYRSIQKQGISGSGQLIDTEDEGIAEDYMSETLEDMVKMMDDLPPEYCDALCSVEFRGMSQAAYAEKTGLSYSGAKSRVQRARGMLKDMLMKCCHYEFDKYGTAIGIYPKDCCCCNK